MGVTIHHPSELARINLTEFGGHDIAELNWDNNGIVYYIIKPQKYFMNMLLRYLFWAVVLAMLTFNVFLLAAPPLYIIFFHKVAIFAKWCETVNYSKKKITWFFIISLILLNIIAVFIRQILGNCF